MEILNDKTLQSLKWNHMVLESQRGIYRDTRKSVEPVSGTPTITGNKRTRAIESQNNYKKGNMEAELVISSNLDKTHQGNLSSVMFSESFPRPQGPRANSSRNQNEVNCTTSKHFPT